MKKIYAIIFMFSVSLVACETDADIEIPAQDPKLVVSSFLNPGVEFQYLKVYMSDPIFDGSTVDNTLMINNANVSISDGVQNVSFGYDFNVDSYVLPRTDMNIDYNKEYTITVSYDGKTVKSTIKTVSNVPLILDEVKIDSILEDDPFGGSYTTYLGYVKWQDPPNETNYYCLELYGLIKNINGDTTRISMSDFYSTVYISDDGKNGSSMNATIEAYQYTPEQIGNGYVGYELLLTKTDEHYYKYFKSLQNYGGDDPFSEPSLIYSNISNGLGLFGSYSPYSFRKAL
jgi:Domain of unknown function (DUF4249)